MREYMYMREFCMKTAPLPSNHPLQNVWSTADIKQIIIVSFEVIKSSCFSLNGKKVKSSAFLLFRSKVVMDHYNNISASNYLTRPIISTIPVSMLGFRNC